ncbi:DNA polymerase I [bacterium]|nr:DNA polymerase I [bacterium]
MDKKRLFLIDGNSHLYRSYYAIRNLSNSKGFPTNAIYGFVTMLKKLKDQENPSHLGIVFDAKGPTIRHRAYKEYKAQRKPMPEDLSVQIPVLKKIIRAYRIPFFEYQDYEADDILGTLARLAKEQNLRTVLVSNDKDLLQLVDENTLVYNPSKEMYFTPEKVKEVFGVAPSQVIDVLSLWGDPTDNIPGVPGIGEKTSKALIQQFGSLQNLLHHRDQIDKALIRNNLTNNLEKLNISRELVTIEKDLSLNFNLEDFSVSEPDHNQLVSLFQDLGFSSLLTEFIQKIDPSTKNYSLILEEKQLKDLISEIKRTQRVALDAETDHPSPTKARLVGLSFSTQSYQAFYLPLGHDYLHVPSQIPKNRALSLLNEILEDPQIKKIGQNIKYDHILLQTEGIQLKGIDLDTMVLSYLLEPNWGKHNLDKLALNYLQIKTIPYEEIAGKGRHQVTLDAVDIHKVAPYACQDADLTLRLSSLLWPRVQRKKLDSLYRKIELPLIPVLADMERWGVKIDSEALKNLSLELDQELTWIQNKIFRLSGEKFNINSPQQLSRILFEKLKLPAFKRTKITKGYSTNVDTLEKLSQNYPIAQHLLEYRQLAKLKTGYADTLPLLIHPQTGRLHTSYNQTVAATGRLSSSEPNLQNIPVRGELGRRFRQAFIPEPGHLFLSADYSQIELRVLAHLSEDPALIETFLHERDVHRETSSKVFGDAPSLSQEEKRRRAKVINFSMVYGTSAFSLARELNTSPSQAKKFMEVYFEKHPRVQEFLEKIVQQAEKNGFSETLFGRKRPVPGLQHKDKATRQAGRRIALNTPIQGTAADLIKKAMVEIRKELAHRRLRSKMILQVHDELVFEVPDEECDEMEFLVKEKMENIYPLQVPLRVHLGWGVNWAEAK